jgi:hypothetical protein
MPLKDIFNNEDFDLQIDTELKGLSITDCRLDSLKHDTKT